MNAPEKLPSMNVYQRLNAARATFHNLKLKKTGHNKFAGYYYFELADFLIPALNVFADCGLCATVSFDASTASMTIRNADKPEDCIVLTSPMGSAALKGCHEVQNIGAVETYQRRYLWVAALEIVEHDALDSSKPLDDIKPANGTITPTTGAWEAMDADEQQFLTEIAMEVVAILNEGKADEAVKLIESHKLQADEKVALWTRFDSKQRSAMKKAGEAMRKKEPTPEEYAQQA